MGAKKQRKTSGLAPVLLRLSLAITFIWAGMGKLRATMEVQGESAAILANMGVIKPTPATATPQPAAPTKPLPPANPPNAPAPEKKDEAPPAEKPKDGGGASAPARTGEQIVPVAFQPQTPGTSAPTSGYSAADFPEKIQVKQLHMLAIAIYTAAHPKATPEKPSPMPLWPPALGGGKMPLYLAYAVTVTEIGAGVLVWLGLFTRLAALGLAGVMAGAMWLTQFGPAIQSGLTVCGFLPDHPRYGLEWSTLLLQLALFAMSLSLVFSGPGYMAADYALFGGRGAPEDHDGE